MRLPLMIVAASLTLAGVAQAQVAPPAQTASAGRVTGRLPITPQPSPDQRLDRVEAALVELDVQLRGLKAQSESLTGLTAEQADRLEASLSEIDRTQTALEKALTKIAAGGQSATTDDAR